MRELMRELRLILCGS